MSTQTHVKELVAIVFLLLGALFGSMLMSFIFGQLGPDAAGLTPADIAYNTSLQVQNDSLQAVKTYSSGASTQMSTVTIAIVMVLLIGIFVIFWNLFIGGKKKSKSSGMGGGYGGNFG